MNKQKEEEISKERSVRIFVASLKSPKTRQDYLRNLERFRKFVPFDSFDRFVERNPKEIQRLVENYMLIMEQLKVIQQLASNFKSAVWNTISEMM